MLIQQELKNVSKLIVTEGHFAEVYNYKDSRELFGPLVTAQKKALVVVNAEVMVIYDLSQVTYDLDEENKTVKIITLFNIVRARALCPPHVVIYEKKQLAARTPCFLNAEDLQRAGSASPWLYNKARIAFTRWRVWVPTALKWSGYQCITIKWFEVDKKTRYPGLQIDRAGKLVPYASMARDSTPRNEPRE